MASTFFGLNIARSGLFAAQQALNVVSHNVSNADTEGYSRQRLTTYQYNPLRLMGDKGMLGAGVDTDAVRQIRDKFLDFKYREEVNIQGEWKFKHETFDMIESIFNEPTNSGINKTTNQFYEAIHEFSKNPESLTTRALVRQRGIALTESLGRMFDRLKTEQKDIDFEINTVISQINGYAKEIVSYNKIIHQTEVDGGVANDVRDQRALVVDKLSELVDARAYEETVQLEDGSYTQRFHVTIMGMPLVSHYNTNELELESRKVKLHADDAHELKEVNWVDDGKKIASFQCSSGRLRALFDMRDGDKEENKGIPYYIDKLNEYVNRAFVEINRIHQKGYGLKDEAGVTQNGIMMFTMDGLNTAEFEAHLKSKGLTRINNTPTPPTVELVGAKEVGSADVPELTGMTAEITQAWADFNAETLTAAQRDDKIAAAIRNEVDAQNNKLSIEMEQYNDKANVEQATYVKKTIMKLSDDKYYLVDQVSCNQFKLSQDVDLDLNKFAAAIDPKKLPGDKNNALDLANIRSNQQMFAWGSPDDYVNSLVANLGVDSQASEKIVKNQKILVTEVENRRQSVMGVSLDEEMSEMVKFQHSYSANARVLTTMDEMLDLIVNRLGLVGR